MNKDEMFLLLEDIDEKYIEKANCYARVKKKNGLITNASAAAILLFFISLMVLNIDYTDDNKTRQVDSTKINNTTTVKSETQYANESTQNSQEEFDCYIVLPTISFNYEGNIYEVIYSYAVVQKMELEQIYDPINITNEMVGEIKTKVDINNEKGVKQSWNVYEYSNAMDDDVVIVEDNEKHYYFAIKREE